LCSPTPPGGNHNQWNQIQRKRFYARHNLFTIPARIMRTSAHYCQRANWPVNMCCVSNLVALLVCGLKQLVCCHSTATDVNPQ
jgi:hypothetical protein